MSKGQGLTRDTLEEVTEAEDLWLQSRERKNPDKKPRTADASPVSRAIVTAWNSKDHSESVRAAVLVTLTMVRGRLGSSESDLLELTAMIENVRIMFNISSTASDTSQVNIRHCSASSFVKSKANR